MSDRPVALVTGGARRVGAAICRALAGAGCDLVVHYHKSEGEARRLLEELSAKGARVELWRADMGDVAALERDAPGVFGRLARLDVLVLNAAIYGTTPVAGVTAARAMEYMATNAVAPLVLCRYAAPLLSKSTLAGGGAIVAMSDMNSTGRPAKDFAAYSMSKAAVAEMVRVLARDLAPRVRVNAVAPGVVAWPEEGFEATAEFKEMYVKRVPLGRAGTPEDAAEVVRWLALEARYVTGEVVRVDGGRGIA